MTALIDHVGTKPSLGAFYSQLFTENFFVFESERPYFQESIVQIIWNEQLFVDDLRTATGAQLNVIHPGVWNLEAGPDFHDAVVFIDGCARRGPVEVHLRPVDWDRHGHSRDAAYAPTVLHVVWENPVGHNAYPDDVPLLVVKDHLKLPLDEILEQYSLTNYPYGSKVQPTRWAERLAQVGDEQLTEVFQSYGLARILQKARSIGERIQRVGLDEAAYQLICDAMGYKSNRDAFAQLTEILPLSDLAGAAPESLMAMLFGAAGLLPDPSQAEVLPELRGHVSELWNLWWGRRREYREITWNRRQRPFNAPERRLLAVGILLERLQTRPGNAIVATFQRGDSGRNIVRELRQAFEIDSERWAYFYTFERKLDKGGALLGRSRADDLIANVAIPLFFAWCFLQNRPQLCFKGREALLALPRLQDNRLFKEAVAHLVVPPARATGVVANACAQQGLLKLYRDYLNGKGELI